MSPEQAGGMEVDARSDIYSLGAIMYELFCGQPMFRGKSFGEYVRKHLTEMPVPPRQTPGGAEIDPRLEALIVRCLDKDPEQRFAHISELRDALLLLLGGMELRPELVGFPRPGAVPLSASGPRSRIGQLPLPPPLPTPASQLSAAWPGAQAPRPAAPPGHAQVPATTPATPATQVSGAYPPPLTLSGEYSLPPAPPPAHAAPSWIWFAGGAVAVALGGAAAIWFAGRDAPDLTPHPAVTATTPTPAPAPAAAPTALPIESPPPPARGHLIEVRFDSRPSGRVFTDDGTAELCQTPCAFDIDLADGGPVDHRGFAVKRAGYVDGLVTVDLTATQREFQVTLVQATSTTGATRPAAKPSAGKADGDRRTAKHPARPQKKAGKDGKDTGRASRDAEATPSEVSKPKPSATRTPPSPATAPAPIPAIDPSDTLDPFQRKEK
jgi:hypothetical protein